MDTTKMTSEQESEIRFNAWRENISSEIAETQSVADSAAVAAIRDSINWKLLEIAVKYYSQAQHLQSVLDEALRVRQLKVEGK